MKLNKKKLLLILTFLGIITTMFSGFTPLHGWNSDKYFEEEYDIKNFELLVTKDISYFFVHRMIKDLRMDSNNEYHSYKLLSLINIETGNSEIYDMSPEQTDYDIQNSGFFTKSTFSILNFFTVVFGLIILFCLFYLAIKSLGVNKNRYFLYIAIIEIIALVSFTLGSYYESAYLNKINFTSGFSVYYGSYIAIFSILLFIVLHFKQDFFIDDKKELKQDKNFE